MANNPILEHDIQNEIRIWCGEHNLLAIRINVGTFRDLYSERVIRTGPPNGWPDLQIFDNKGHIIFCECKAKYGRLRGNIHYKEDRWFVQISPISITYKNETKFIENKDKDGNFISYYPQIVFNNIPEYLLDTQLKDVPVLLKNKG